GAPRALRALGAALLPRERAQRPLPGGLRVLLAVARLDGPDRPLPAALAAGVAGGSAPGGGGEGRHPLHRHQRQGGAGAGEVERVAEAVREIKSELPLRVCCCLGILSEGQAEQLKAAGVDRFNHNLNTSAGFHENICSTHIYEDRVRTVERVKAAGISPCCG